MTAILHILDHSLPLHSGYTFRTRAIMSAQQRAGHNVAGITGLRHNRNIAALSSAAPAPDLAALGPETVSGLDFYRTTGLPGRTPFVAEYNEARRLASRIVELTRTFRPDIMHAHSPALCGLAAHMASQKTGIPFIYEIRAFWEDAAVSNGTDRENSLRYRLKRQLENHVISRAGALAVICHGLKQDLVSRGVEADSILVSPNGVDLSLFGEPAQADEKMRHQLGLQGKRVLGFIGSFYDYEGLDDLISAMPELGRRFDNVHLLLIGGGMQEQALKAQAKQLGLEHAITFTGRVPHDQVERYYSLIDILVYPRKSMRLTEIVTPLKPLEAMAQMRLVAASDVGGHRELIKDGETGTLFAADQPQSLARSVGDLLDSSDIWQSRRNHARQWVREHHDWDRNINRYFPVYQKLTN